MEKITFNKTRWHGLRVLGPNVIDDCNFKIEKRGLDMVLELDAHILALDKGVHTFTAVTYAYASWWDHLKATRLPSWLPFCGMINRKRVETEHHFEVKDLYPGATMVIPDMGKGIRFCAEIERTDSPCP